MNSAYKLLLEKRPPEWALPLRQIALLKALDRALRVSLEGALADHCQAGPIHGQCMTVWADAPVWATKLRFSAAQLVEKLNKFPGLPAIGEIKVKVRPPRVAPQKAQQIARRPMSHRAHQDMKNELMTINDPALRTALLRLAGRLK